VTYTWSAPDGGTFPYGDTGGSVTWQAPPTPGGYRVCVTVNDEDGHPPPGEGSDDDAPKTAELTVEVIRLDKVRLYYYYPNTGYPYAGDAQIDTRAVVWATCTTQQAYHGPGLSFDTGLTYWWEAGDEGPRRETAASCDTLDIEPPVTGIYTGTPAQWPSNWPALDIDWKLLWHQQTDPCAGYPRKYLYSDDTVYLTDSWGEDNRTYTTQGLHRLRATATIHPGAGEQKGERTVTSRDKEYALRICPKAYCDWIDNAMRRAYVEWCSTYVNEPYEWGGEGYGGFDSEDQCAGGGALYEGYGIDCSGLVSCGAYRAGYNWSVHVGNCDTWRVGTCALAGNYCSDPISEDDFGEGDIIVDCEVHVVSCVERQGTSNDIRIIHASGSAGKVLNQDSSITYWTEDEDYNYVLRRLKAH